MKYYLSILSLCLLFVSCTNRETKNIENQNYDVKYAKLFKVDKQDGYTLVSVLNPWGENTILQQYALADDVSLIPDSLKNVRIVKTPLTTVGATSLISCSILDELQSIDLVKGVCEPEIISIKAIQDGLQSGKVIDLGKADKMNIEKSIALNPNVIFAAPIPGMTYGGIEKTGITLVESVDYMEEDPLGRAEWIRFFSLFVGKEALGDSIFNEIEKNYLEIKNQVTKIEKKPTVLLDMKYGNVWYMPGGKSFMSRMIADAGGDYLWKDDETTGASPLSFEQVLSKGENADIWVIRYGNPKDYTMSSLKKEYDLYSHFSAFKNKNVFASNLTYSEFYKDLPVHPEWILKDLAKLFHPTLYENYEPKYFKKLED